MQFLCTNLYEDVALTTHHRTSTNEYLATIYFALAHNQSITSWTAPKVYKYWAASIAELTAESYDPCTARSGTTSFNT